MNTKGKLLVDAEDFARHNIKKGESQVWEDGIHLDLKNLKPGEWEWWYSDGHLDNGAFFVASYHLDVDAQGKVRYFLRVNIANETGIILDKEIPIAADTVKLSKDICASYFGSSFIKSLDGLNKYEIFLDPKTIEGNNGLHIIMEKTVPTFKPGTGFWESNGKYFAWLCAVPSATITGTITINGKEEKITGNGYHDHNWGKCPMNEILGDWLWSRGEIDGITAVVSSVRFNEQNGGQETNFVYLAEGENILIDAINEEVTCLEGVKIPHPDTGKKISSDCIYIVKNNEGYNYIRFQGKQIVASFPFGENDAYITYYARFVSETILDLNVQERHIQGQAHSTLEVMDFLGKKK